ncbi:hypothetical protein DUNSADRAFT_6276 [Dunaliella salina]|uniref:RBR-type E3 ubiquitin transferase n=1 Tax=Dunaliella salina TaxID=3046 RepID=A0ABQ7GNM7_DUNSA|nr:hypothetical protein DUNSADRAFT_6276 [Dunaliella salina]|eukprot:KAF5836210.1 hypothetical protein DUNSADRAFT_6276 [Dunaliella salina]
MSDSEEYASGSLMEDEEEEEQESASDQEKDFGLDNSVTVSKKPAYRILKGETLEERRKQALEEVTGVLGITEEDAARLLRRFKWDVTRVHEEWFSNYDAVRASVGLQDEAPVPSTSQATCMICFESYPTDQMYSASCRHLFCHDCWQGYTSTAIADGPACLDLRCPDPKCTACVPTSIIKRTAPPEALAKYQSFCVRSFVEDNRSLVWCVGRGCECAVECCVDRTADEALDVICSSCGATFCFNCKEEAHRPVSCEWVRKWAIKNSAESENVHWIIANTKPCPRCSRPIEKNQGCMHMTCSQCRFEFCWLCQGDWKEHGDRTGGFFNCNRYDAAKRKGDYDEETRKRDNAKQSLERYMHYFERWDAHQKARNKAKADQARISADWLERLSEQTKTPSSQLKFIMDAWSQIIECRRVLSWTYTYGYYALEDMDHKASSTKEGNSSAEENQRFFFEFLQADAERSLERLHEAAEVQLKKVMENNSTAQGNGAPLDLDSFMAFRTHLIGLTDVTRGYFEKLVRQLEKGFEDLERDFGGGSAEEAALIETTL